MSAAQQWADDLASWAIPQYILDQAPESPWFHDPATFAAEGPLPRQSLSARRGRSALQAIGGGSVLDVGCGGGRAGFALTPDATHITGIDTSEHMLANFAAAADKLRIAHTAIQGRWPDVCADAPVADVVVCHHVLYNVADIAPFLWTLTEKARHRVVVEITPAHPQSSSSPAWKHFWGIDRPTRPVATDVPAILAELGLDATLEMGPRSEMAPAATDPTREVPFLRRRLCLPPSRDNEIAAFLRDHPPTRSPDVATISWASVNR